MTSPSVDDYSTDTGLRVRIKSDGTGTAVQLLGTEWEQLKADIKAGRHDHIAQEPIRPFIY